LHNDNKHRGIHKHKMKREEKKETVDCEERFSKGRIDGGTSNFHDRLSGIKHERRGIWRGLRLDEHAPALPMSAKEYEGNAKNEPFIQ